MANLDLNFGNSLNLSPKRKKSQPTEADPSALAQVGRKVTGGLAAIGNVLDLPGSSVRDALVGKNPLDQWLTPTREDNRTTGRELLRHHGIVGQSDTTGNWWGGLGAEIALDPLTYATFGASALGKAGKVAKAAGALDDITRVAARAAGKTVGSIGPREARVTTTLRQLAKHGEPGTARKLAQQAKVQGVKLKSIADEPLGGLMGIGAPFSEPVKIIGQGASKTARTLDRAVSAVKHVKVPGTNFEPINTLHRTFDSTIREMATPVMQHAARTMFGRKESGRAAARGVIAEYTTKLGGKADNSKLLRRAFEEQVPERVEAFAKEAQNDALKGLQEHQQKLAASKDPASQAAAQTVMNAVTDKAVRATLPKTLQKSLNDSDRLARMTTRAYKTEARRAAKLGLPAGTKRPLYSTLPKELQSVVDDAHGKLDKVIATAKEYGIDPKQYIDPEIEYFPRYLVETAAKGVKGGGLAMSTIEASRIGRKEFLHSIRGGTTTIQKIASDPKVEKIIANGGTRQQIAKFLKAKYGKAIPKKYLPRDGSKPRDTYRAMAKWLGNLSPETRKAGVFGNHPLADLQQRLAGASDAISAAKTGIETLAKDIPLQAGSKAASVPGTVTLKRLLSSVGIKPSGLAKVAQLRGMATDPKTLAALGNARIASKHADDFARFLQGFKSPEPAGQIVQAIDSVTNLTKTGLTSLWPAFHVRNLASGQWNNWVGGMFSPQSVKDAHAMLRGETVKGASQIPVIQQMAKQRGVALDDKVATDLLRELSYAHEIVGKYEGVAMAQGRSGRGTLADILGEMPGKNPVKFREMGRKAVGRAPDTNFNPLDVRGVGGRVETKFGPAAAGQDLGHYVEGLNRLSPFLHQLRQGVDAGHAAARIGAAQVQYASRHFTKTEQQFLSRLFPFYKFSRGMLPWTLRQLYEKPGGKLATAIHATNRAHGPDELTPDYISETASIPVPGGKDGNKRYVTSFGLPFEDTAQLLSPSIQGAGLEALSRINPLLKGLMEYATGVSFFQKGPHGGRPLDELDPSLGRTLANITGRKEPVTFPGSTAIEAALANSPISRLSTTARTLTDNRKGVAGKVGNLLTGVRLTDVSPAQQDRVLLSRAQELERALGGRQYTESYIPKDKKASLSEEDRKAAERIAQLKKILEERRKHRATASRGT